MIFPEIEDFEKIKEDYDKITVYREIFADTFTPITFLMKFSNEKYLFLLESVNIDKTFSRFSFFGINPTKIILGKGDLTYIHYNNGEKVEIKENIVSYLKRNYQNFTQYTSDNFGDFAGGLVGYFGYESVNFMNILRKNIKMDNNVHSGFFEINEFFVFDNFKNRLYAAKCINNNKDEYLAAVDYLKSLNFNKINNAEFGNSGNYKIFSEYSKLQFIEKVKNIKEEILNGEAIQVVFSQKYNIEGNINPTSFYRAIRQINPSPYMFFLKFDTNIVTGSSPETHLKIKSRKALLKPIAGTYPVEKDIEKVKSNLLNDKKEAAEHLMLLDLARNDLYQGCTIDSVKVKKAFVTEVYSHVVHIVSEVEGIVRRDITSFDLFFKTFPAGTVSGAPKVRAIELIDKYEDSVRGFYAGCVGYIGYNHDLDTCITIRSAFFQKNTIVIRAGAGIVADSIPENEYFEVKRKLKALFKGFEMIKEIEKQNVFINR